MTKITVTGTFRPVAGVTSGSLAAGYAAAPKKPCQAVNGGEKDRRFVGETLIVVKTSSARIEIQDGARETVPPPPPPLVALLSHFPFLLSLSLSLPLLHLYIHWFHARFWKKKRKGYIKEVAI